MTIQYSRNCKGQRVAPDEVGKVYGRLMVIETSGRDKRSGSAMWLCECICGNRSTVMAQSLRSGNTQSCGCFKRDKAKELHSLPSGESALNRAVSNTRRNAKTRNYEFSLSTDEAKNLMIQNCYYCGIDPKQMSRGRNGNVFYNGLDRVDNSVGYTKTNVVPCCFNCNRAKGEMTVSEFRHWIGKVIETFLLKEKEK